MFLEWKKRRLRHFEVGGGNGWMDKASWLERRKKVACFLSKDVDPKSGVAANSIPLLAPHKRL
jgi:hypothetical protein